MKYHKASELFRLFGTKYDWSTEEGAADGLRSQLELENYGPAFRLYRDGMPLDENAARQAVLGMLDRGLMARHLDTIQRMLGAGDNPRDCAVLARPDGSGGLRLEHGDFDEALDLDAAGLRLAGPTESRSRGRSKAIEQKHLETRGTSEDDYLLHANQCGFLLRNARLDFLKSRRMQGTSVKMRIPNLTMDHLRQFTDAAGKHSLAALSTHRDTEVEPDGAIYSGWIGFSLAVVDFLNLEDVIDVEGLKARHRDIAHSIPGGDTGFRLLSDWGAGPESAIGELVSRRPDIDAGKIRERFMAGYGGELGSMRTAWSWTEERLKDALHVLRAFVGAFDAAADADQKQGSLRAARDLAARALDEKRQPGFRFEKKPRDASMRTAWNWTEERLKDALHVLRAFVGAFDAADTDRRQADLRVVRGWAARVLDERQAPGFRPELPADPS